MKRFAIAAAPHLPATRKVSQLMRDVLLALLPAILAHWWFFGPGILLQILLAISFALLFEAGMLALRARPLRPFLGDGSAVVAAVLFALCVPPWAPWWIAAVGMLSAIVLAKQLYGGLGFNTFNPAMVGYAVVLISFPLELSSWLSPAGIGEYRAGWGDSARAIFLGQLPPGMLWDTLTQSTPLDALRSGASQNLTVPEIRSAAIFGDFGGRGWEWIANAYLLGGLWLLWRRVAAWQVPLTMLLSALLMATVLHLINADRYTFPADHLFLGGIMLGAFFIATDPVSGCTTPRGRLIFGAGCGLLVIIIRTWGGYPDGVAFAVLLMNCFAPWIDQHSRPRIFGAPK